MKCRGGIEERPGEICGLELRDCHPTVCCTAYGECKPEAMTNSISIRLFFYSTRKPKQVSRTCAVEESFVSPMAPSQRPAVATLVAHASW
jgi:hypothetical protein